MAKTKPKYAFIQVSGTSVRVLASTKKARKGSVYLGQFKADYPIKRLIFDLQSQIATLVKKSVF